MKGCFQMYENPIANQLYKQIQSLKQIANTKVWKYVSLSKLTGDEYQHGLSTETFAKAHIFLFLMTFEMRWIDLFQALIECSFL